MARGVRKYLVSSVVLVALIAVAGCTHYMFAEREPWRREAELSCLNSGAVKESPTRVRIAAINGPGICGMDYPLRVSSLGDGAPLSYDDEPIRPPGSIPEGSMPQHWPGTGPASRAGASGSVQSSVLPPPNMPPPRYPPAPASAPQTLTPRPASSAPPLSLDPQGAAASDSDEELGIPGGPPHPYYGGPSAPSYPAAQAYPAPAANGSLPPLGPPAAPNATAAVGPVEVKPAATLACPIVSALDQWMDQAVQPAALRWFRQPVVEIKQISAYSCRGMNGNPNAHISEHAFGNALDIAEFELADGHKISVQYGWHGTPEEQAFLHDVQGAACDQFTTVLAPGANVYHYNHIHVDLMRHYNGRHICEPAAIPGEVVAERARAHYANQHYGETGTTGSIKSRIRRALGYSGEDDDSRPEAMPGDD